ncbi:hypothetical protein SAMN05421541_109357 [Actinoplanes philippinensis]|uniref:Uncharacterized protein n=1 Tax=Actinoplanes philippinensis TaxID=35752 RepID=A0A1I2IB94_9ACTN|nr:hypothetical protein [Actinoplanes philippinensis]SFF37811.1 hypothetical protein SAMN05421541_109357 [Actinoplanes philippinensis]
MNDRTPVAFTAEAAAFWTPTLLLRKTTGRGPVTTAETRMLDGLGLRTDAGTIRLTPWAVQAA